MCAFGQQGKESAGPEGSGSKGRSRSPAQDIQAHAVTLSDGSEMSYAISAASGSSQTFVHRAGSIPEEHEVHI